MTRAIFCLLFFCCYLSSYSQKFNPNQHIKTGDVLPKTLIVKLNEEFSPLSTEVQNAFRKLNIDLVEKAFPFHKKNENTFNKWGQKLVDLSNIYILKYQADYSEVNAAVWLQSFPVFEYAQPYFLVHPFIDNAVQLVPNDEYYMHQWYIRKIKADDAWNLNTGDPNVIIALVDGGTSFGHPDLINNIAYNLNDTIDGIDNDGDGYIDNYYGWDFGDNDNNPQYSLAHGSEHGTAMAGVLGATPDNNIGIASAGFYCKYLPIKIVDSYYGWTSGYQGIVYAADHGAQIINCSWGNQFYAPFEQNIIDYASINKNSLVIAAAGNSNNTIPFYPASYELVLAIGGVDSFDVKSNSSSYYEFVDLVSPGYQLLTTNRESYIHSNGTSIASALTSGAAGLLLSHFPNFTPAQIGALMQQTTDRIDTIAGNASFANKQGSGRLNLLSAMTNNIKPHIYFYNSNLADVTTVTNDTIVLRGNFINYLANASYQLKVEVSSLSPQYIEWIDSSFTLGALQSLDTTSNYSLPFKFRAKPNCPSNQNIVFKLQYSDGIKLNTQYIKTTINRTYLDLHSGNLSLTITSTGRLGYADNATTMGLGLKYKNWGDQLLNTSYNPMGFWVAESSTKVSNQTLAGNINSCCPYNTDNHFKNTQPLAYNYSTVQGITETISKYDDSNAFANAIGIEITQRSQSFSSAADSNIIFLEYNIKNQTNNGKANLYAGIYSDVEICDTLLSRNLNFAFYDTINSMGVMLNPDGKVFIGIKALSPLSVSYYAFNVDGTDSINITNGFTIAEKWQAISNGLQKTKSDTTDIAQLIALKIDSLSPKGCTSLHFAVLAADNLSDLRQRAIYAQQKFNNEYNFWTGAALNDNWHDLNNWSKNSVPSALDFVIIPDVSAQNTPSPKIFSANAFAKNIRIQCGGKLKIENNKELIIK